MDGSTMCDFAIAPIGEYEMGESGKIPIYIIYHHA